MYRINTIDTKNKTTMQYDKTTDLKEAIIMARNLQNFIKVFIKSDTDKVYIAKIK